MKKVKTYEGMASIYDHLVAGVDFEGWIDYLHSIMANFGLQADTVADLACGTGNTVLPLARRGYRAIGLDLSGEMLAIAQKKALAQGLSIEFLCADMREFHLPFPVSLATCFHDGLNYLTGEDDLLKTLLSVRYNLLPGGSFIFDLNAVNWLSGTRPEVTMVEEEGLTIIWESSYDSGDEIWEVRLTGFACEGEGELYRKFKEVHREKAYRPDQVASILGAAGFELLASYDAFTFNPIHEKSRRHFYVARKR